MSGYYQGRSTYAFSTSKYQGIASEQVSVLKKQKKNAHIVHSFLYSSYAVTTASAVAFAACFAVVRIQRVQTIFPSIFWRFGYCLRMALIFEWLRLAAFFDPLPHMSQVRAIGVVLELICM